MRSITNSSYENVDSLKNDRSLHNIKTNKHVVEGRTDHSSSATKEDRQMDEIKGSKQNEERISLYDKKEECNKVTNEILRNHDKLFNHDQHNMKIMNKIKNDEWVEKRQQTFSTNVSHVNFLKKKKKKKNIFGIHLSKKKCQENIEKINEKINCTMKRIFKLYKESNKKQYLSMLFQMKDINCFFSCMFFCLLIIFSIMNECVGALLSTLLLIISIQLKYSRSNMALLNSIIAIIFISVATAYSFSNIKYKDIHGPSNAQIDITNANTNRKLLILETIICLVYASILFIYMFSLRSVKKFRQRHIWVYHHIVTFFNFLDIGILFTFGILAFFCIFICLKDTLFIIISSILFSSSVLTYSLRKYSSIATLIFQTVMIITNTIIASASLTKNITMAKIVDIPSDGLQELHNKIYLFYMVFLIFFLVLHLLYIFYIFFSYTNVLSKCFSQRSAYYSSIFPHSASIEGGHDSWNNHESANGHNDDESDQNNMQNDRCKNGNIQNMGEIHFVREKYVLSLDDNNKILNIQKKSIKKINIDMDKYMYDELHLYKHLLLNTVTELKHSLGKHKERRISMGDRIYRGKMGNPKNFKGTKRSSNPKHENNNHVEDFILSINGESSECLSNYNDTDDDAHIIQNKARYRNKYKNNAYKRTPFLLKNLSLIKEERSRNKNIQSKPLMNHDLYLTHCENDIYSSASLFHSKYTYIIDVLLENYDELIFYLNKRKFFMKIIQLLEGGNPCDNRKNGLNEGDIMNDGSVVNSNSKYLLEKNSNNVSSVNLSHPICEDNAESIPLDTLSPQIDSLKNATSSSLEENSSHYMNTNFISQLSTSPRLVNEYEKENENVNKSRNLSKCKNCLINNAPICTDLLNTIEEDLSECYSMFILNSDTNTKYEKGNSLFSNFNNDYMNIPIFPTASKFPNDDKSSKKEENIFWYYYPGIIGRVYKEWLKCKNLDYKKMNNDFYYLFTNSNSLHDFIKSNHTTLEKQEDVKLFDISQVLSSNKSIVNTIKKSFSSVKGSNLFTEDIYNINSLNGIINNFLADINTDMESFYLINSKKTQPYLDDISIKQFLFSLHEHNGSELTCEKMTLPPSRFIPDLIEQLDQIVVENISQNCVQRMDCSISIEKKMVPYDRDSSDGSIQNGVFKGEKQTMGKITLEQTRGQTHEDLININPTYSPKNQCENFDLNDLLNYAESLIMQNKQNELAKESVLLNKDDVNVQMQNDSDADSTDIKHFDEILSNFIKNFVSTRDNNMQHNSFKQGGEKDEEQINSLKNIEEIYSNIKKTICDEKQLSKAANGEGRNSPNHNFELESTQKNGEHLAKQIINTKKKEMYLKKRNLHNNHYLSDTLEKAEIQKGEEYMKENYENGKDKHEKLYDTNALIKIHTNEGKKQCMNKLNTIKNKSKNSIECLRKKSKTDTSQLSYSELNEYIYNDLKNEKKKKKKKMYSNTILSKIHCTSSDDESMNMKTSSNSSNGTENNEDQNKRKNKIHEKNNFLVLHNQKDDHLSKTQNLNNISEHFANFYATDGGHVLNMHKEFAFIDKGYLSNLKNVEKGQGGKANQWTQHTNGKNSPSCSNSISRTYERENSNSEKIGDIYCNIEQRKSKDDIIEGEIHIQNNDKIDDKANSNYKGNSNNALLRDKHKMERKEEKYKKTGAESKIANNMKNNFFLSENNQNNNSVRKVMQYSQYQATANDEYKHGGTEKNIKIEKYKDNICKEISIHQWKEKENKKINHQIVDVNVNAVNDISKDIPSVEKHYMYSSQVCYNASRNIDSAKICTKNVEEKNNGSHIFSSSHQTNSNFNLDTQDLIKDLKKYLSSSSNNVDVEDSILNDTFLLEFINKYLENSNPCNLSIYNEVLFDKAKENMSGDTSNSDTYKENNEMKNEFMEHSMDNNTKKVRTIHLDFYNEKKLQKEKDKITKDDFHSNFYDAHIVNFLNTYMLENSNRLVKSAVLKEKHTNNTKLEEHLEKTKESLEASSELSYKKSEKKEDISRFNYDNYKQDKYYYIDYSDKQEEGQNKVENSISKGTHLKTIKNDTLIQKNMLGLEINKHQFNSNSINFISPYVPRNSNGVIGYNSRDRNGQMMFELNKEKNMLQELRSSNGEREKIEERKGKLTNEYTQKQANSDIFYSINNFENLEEDETFCHLKKKMENRNHHSMEEKENIIKKADLNLVLQNIDNSEENKDFTPSDEKNCSGSLEMLKNANQNHIYQPDVNIFNESYGFQNKISDSSSSTDNDLTGLLIGSDVFYESFAYKSITDIDNMKRRIHEYNNKGVTYNENQSVYEKHGSNVINDTMNGTSSKDKKNYIHGQVKNNTMVLDKHSHVSNEKSDKRSHNLDDKTNEEKEKVDQYHDAVSLISYNSDYSKLHDEVKTKYNNNYFVRKNMNGSDKVSNHHGNTHSGVVNRGEVSPNEENATYIYLDKRTYKKKEEQQEQQHVKEENYAQKNFMNYEIYDNSKIADGNIAGSGINEKDHSKGKTYGGAKKESFDEAKKESLDKAKNDSLDEAKKESLDEESTEEQGKQFAKTSYVQENKINLCNNGTKMNENTFDNAGKEDNNMNIPQSDNNNVTKMLIYNESEASRTLFSSLYKRKLYNRNRSASSNSFTGMSSSSMSSKTPMDTKKDLLNNHLKGNNKSEGSSSIELYQVENGQTNEYKKKTNNLYQQYPMEIGESGINSKRDGENIYNDSNATKEGKKKNENQNEDEIDMGIEGNGDIGYDYCIDGNTHKNRMKRKDKRTLKYNAKLAVTEETSINLENSKRTESDFENENCITKSEFLYKNRYNHINEEKEEGKKKYNHYPIKGKIINNSDNIFNNSNYIQHFNSIIKTYSWSPENLHIEENNCSFKKYNTCIDTASTEDSDDASKISNFVKDIFEQNSNSIISSSEYENVGKKKHKKQFNSEKKTHSPLKLHKGKNEYKYKSIHEEVMKNIKTDTQESFIELIEQGDVFPTIRRRTEGNDTLHDNIFSNNYKNLERKKKKLSKRNMSSVQVTEHKNYSNECKHIRDTSEQIYETNENKDFEELQNLSDNGLKFDDVKIFTDDGFNDEYNYYNWNEMNNEVNREMNKTKSYRKKYFLKKKINNLKMLEQDFNIDYINTNLSDDIYLTSASGLKESNISSTFYNNTERMRRTLTNADANSSNIYNSEKRGMKNVKSFKAFKAFSMSEKKAISKGKKENRTKIPLKTGNNTHDSNYEIKKNLTKSNLRKNNNTTVTTSFNDETIIKNNTAVKNIMPLYEPFHINSSFSFESKYKENLWKKIKSEEPEKEVNLVNGSQTDARIVQHTVEYYPNDNKAIHNKYGNVSNNSSKNIIKKNSKGGIEKNSVKQKKKSLSLEKTRKKHLGEDLANASKKNSVHDLKKKLAAKNTLAKKEQVKNSPNQNSINKGLKKKAHIDPKKLTSVIQNFKNSKTISYDIVKTGQVKQSLSNVDASNKKRRPIKLRYSVDNFYNVINSEDDVNEEMFINSSK
ncbi:hypothetical protein, conserved [Plasmodium gonderi]|uniref:Basal complex transmembrane protein 2 n=1 Tax=Plasmodium gonderi TaxID=77519 RepID=A0A1Y1J9D7_PLAGO|nr:hypothetical protein, conserved [Plasmodium gonderi]GAW78880.1 hypothetical protein, conserved [Plasmodium gonderi]